MSKAVCIIEFKWGFTEELIPHPQSKLLPESTLPISNRKISSKIRFHIPSSFLFFIFLETRYPAQQVTNLGDQIPWLILFDLFYFILFFKTQYQTQGSTNLGNQSHLH